MSINLTRVYHPLHLWEEIHHNMWGEVDDCKEMFKEAVAFTGNHILYGSFMMKVIKEWPVSCENALTDYSLNRKAWVGHAATALALKCPEDITRKAWGVLRYEQQLLANKEAVRAIRTWEDAYRKNKGIHTDMGESLL